MGTERRILTLVLAGLALIGLAAFASWFLTHFERRTEQIQVGASAAARRNDWLAAERFLKALEIPVESVAGRERLRNLPPPTDTLVVRELGPMNAERRDRLGAWLEQGGVLVVEAMPVAADGATSDDFLAEFGIRLGALDADMPDQDEDGEVVAEVSIGDLRRTLKVSFLTRFHLEIETAAVPVSGIQAADRWRVVQRPVGAGGLTVLSDSRFMTNDGIGRQDHALLTAELVAPQAGGKVWLIHDSGMPWLGALLWSAAPLALISGAILVAVWLWSLGRRLGPLEAPPEGRQRDLLEHLEASADFLWRQGLIASLVAPSRRRLLALWQHRQRACDPGDPAHQVAALAEATGEPAEAVAQALLGEAREVAGFIVQGQRLQTLFTKIRHSGWTHQSPRGDE